MEKTLRRKINKMLIVLMLLSFSAMAQPNDSVFSAHTIGVRFGVNQIKEENLHPKVSTGTITELDYGFEKKRESWHQFHFSIGYSRLKTKFEELSKTLNLELHTGYSWSYPLVNKKSFQYFLGPEGSVAYHVSFFPNWDDSHLYWANYYSLGIRNSFLVRFKNENEWTVFLSLPLFSVFSRPDAYRLYKIDDTDFSGIMHNLNSNICPAHLVNVLYINFRSEYRFPVFKNKRQAFVYSFQYNRVKENDGNTFSRLSHQIGIKFFL